MQCYSYAVHDTKIPQQQKNVLRQIYHNYNIAGCHLKLNTIHRKLPTHEQ